MAMVAENDPRLAFLLEEIAIKPPLLAHYLEQFVNRWWVVHKETRCLVFWDSEGGRKTYGGSRVKQAELKRAVPQCNHQKEITEAIIARMYPWAEPVHFDRVYREFDIQQFQAINRD